MGIGCDGRSGSELGSDEGCTVLHGMLRGVWVPCSMRLEGDFYETGRQSRRRSQGFARYHLFSKLCRWVYFYRASARWCPHRVMLAF
jgi:hypothetical protein